MTPCPSPIADTLAPLLQAEAELIAEIGVEDGIVSGVLGREHPMAWRWLRENDAVEALTLAATSPAKLDTMPHWRDPGWVLSQPQVLHGMKLTLWWHAESSQAMLASQIPLDELRRDSVVSTLRLHVDGLHLCQRRRRSPQGLDADACASARDASSGFARGFA